MQQGYGLLRVRTVCKKAVDDAAKTVEDDQKREGQLIERAAKAKGRNFSISTSTSSKLTDVMMAAEEATVPTSIESIGKASIDVNVDEDTEERRLSPGEVYI